MEQASGPEQAETSPTVSVLMAAYNVKESIGRAIASVQMQTWPNWQLIVVDDSSADGTDQIVASLAQGDPRIRLIRHARNQGPAAARNTALDAAEGQWIAVLDADDAWKPERLEVMLKVARDSGSTFVADNLAFYDDALKREGGIVFSIPKSPRPLTAEDLFSTGFGNPGFSFGLLKPLISTNRIREVGARYAERLRYGEDLHFYAQLLVSRSNAVVLAAPYYIYTAPFGPKSGQRARNSQTNRESEDRWAGCLWLHDDLDRRFGEVMTPGLRAAMSDWRARMERMWVQGRMVRLLRERKFRDTLLLAARHPAHAARLLTFKRLARVSRRQLA